MPIHQDDSNLPELTRLFSFQMRRFHMLYSRASALIYTNRYGLTNAECRVIAELIPFMDEDVPLAQLIAKTSVDNGMATRIINQLIIKGIVKRTVDASDARVRHIAFTEYGREVGAGIHNIILERDKRLMSRLSPRQRATLRKAMDVLIEEAEQMLHEERAHREGQ